MKKLLVSVSVLLSVIFAFALDMPVASAADTGSEYITMYKAYFRDLQEKRYQSVWDATAKNSKNMIAKMIHVAAQKQNRESTQADVLNRLENNTARYRSNFFDKLNEKFEQIGFFRDVLAGQYSVKSSSAQNVIITISVKNEPKDFRIVREAGRWKINFFEDISN